MPIVCPACKHREMVGALFCRHCGYPVWKEVSRAANTSTSGQTSDAGATTERVRLRLPNGIEVALTGSGPWLVGRPSSDVQPDLNAQAWGARHVSRRHARLEWRHGGLYIVDLDSTNGTWVNGRRLTPHEPKRLHDGDWVRWADLEVQIVLPTPGSPDATEDDAS